MEPEQALPSDSNAETATAAAVVAAPDTRPPLSKAIFGILLICVSLVGALALIAVYFPTLAVETPESQAAAAAARDDAKFFESLDLKAKSAYVYDVTTDHEVFARNAGAQLPLASITKVALVLAISEVLTPESTVTISRRAVERGEGGLTWGEQWQTRDLIDFTLMTSSNTGAEALAEAADSALKAKYPEAPEGEAAVWRMNALAHELGMNETYFINPTGLDESVTQAGAQSSARDIAKLLTYALRTNRNLFAITTKETATLGPLNAPERHAINTNDALPEIAGLIIGKTGTTDLAGANIAIAYDVSDSHPMIVVVLGSTPEARFTDLLALTNAAHTASLEGKEQK